MFLALGLALCKARGCYGLQRPGSWVLSDSGGSLDFVFSCVMLLQPAAMNITYQLYTQTVRCQGLTGDSD